MKETLSKHLSKILNLPEKEIESILEIPPSSNLGDYSFPCFSLAKSLKKNPNEIAREIEEKISKKEFEKVEVKGAYVNFFISRKILAEKVVKKVLKEKNKFGSSKIGKGKTVVIDMSSPNIAKPFGVGHLRSTLIGNSIANISSFLGFKVIKLNYLGDWGTPFGKIIAGFKKFGSEKELKKNPIKHLYEIYTKVSSIEEYEEIGRNEFKKLESGDKESLALWKKFRELSIKDFEKIYSLLNIKFDVTMGESDYNGKMENTLKELKSKNLLKESDGAQIVNLERFGLGMCLIQKSDGTTLYATRDITAAIDRVKRFKADYLLYEVGAEQKLHFKQFFKILELLGYKFAKNCVHIDHGLYLDKDGKKLATRKGKTIFMEDVLEETIELARRELSKREKLSKSELENRALKIARAAIFYGDLKNFRASDAIFDIEKFLKFEGDTGPYLLYTYARAKSILRKVENKKPFKISEISDKEKKLILELSKFSEIVEKSYGTFSPNLIANYAFQLSQVFNEFYHSEKVIGSKNESFRLALVESFAHVLKNSLALLGIETLEEM